MPKFNVGDVVRTAKMGEDEYFKIRGVYEDCYDAAFCNAEGVEDDPGGSIDIWFDIDDDDYYTEKDFEKVK